MREKKGKKTKKRSAQSKKGLNTRSKKFFFYRFQREKTTTNGATKKKIGAREEGRKKECARASEREKWEENENNLVSCAQLFIFINLFGIFQIWSIFPVNFGEWKWIWARTWKRARYTKTATMALLRAWATREMKLVYLNKFGYISAPIFFSFSFTLFCRMKNVLNISLFEWKQMHRASLGKNSLTFTSEPEKPTNCSQI